MRTTKAIVPSSSRPDRFTRRRVSPRTVIVGAGIAGLTVAERLIAAGTNPTDITILEKYDYVGGRIVSHKDGYEIGAGRINTSHHHVNALIDRFRLTRMPLALTVTWLPLGAASTTPIKNDFEADLRIAIRPIREAAEEGTHTLRQLLARTMSAPELTAFLDRFPYRAETEILRSDLALQSFKPRGEMGSHTGYFVLREGLSAITRAIRDELVSAGVTIRLNTEVCRVDATGAIHIRGHRRPLFPARTVVALHASALQHILPPPAAHQIHRFLRMEPLTRIYAAYPPEHPWTRRLFSGPPIVTDSPLRYIIPVNPEKGTIMISYTEGRDTRHWRGLKGPRLQAAIQKEVRRLFSGETEIPEPIWVRPYEWTDGCTYWRPGRYDPHRVAAALQHLYPTVWIAGESLSVGRQAWIEGALEVAHQVADRIVASL